MACHKKKKKTAVWCHGRIYQVKGEINNSDGTQRYNK